MQSLSDSLKYPGAHYKACGPFACDIVKTLLFLIAGKYQKEEVVIAASRPLVKTAINICSIRLSPIFFVI